MSKLKATPAVHNVATLEDLKRFVNNFIGDVFGTVNGGLEFKSNLWTDIQDVSFVAANTETQVAHGLQKVPTGYMLCGSNVSTTLYDGTSSWTKTHLYLKSSAIANVKVLIF